MLLSKSTHNKTILWRPDRNNKRRADAVNVLQELRNSRADIWYIRFGLNFDNTLLATGSRDGQR